MASAMKPGRRARASAVLAILISASSAWAAGGSGPRFRFDVGPALQDPIFTKASTLGIGASSGVELGRRLSFFLRLEFDYFPIFDKQGFRDEYRFPSNTTVGDRTLSLLSGTGGLKLVLLNGSVRPFVTVAIGAVSVVEDRYGVVDPQNPTQPHPFGGTERGWALVSAGGGVQTHRPQGLDYFVAYEARTGVDFEYNFGPYSTVRIGILTP